MARNDAVLLDGIIDERISISLPNEKRDEVFEYFAFEQILRDADLTQEEILSGSIDGRDDGGIDGIFVLVNGNLVTDLGTFPWPKRNAHLIVHIVTCKHHDTFRQAPVDNLAATISEFFDFSIPNDKLRGAYSAKLKHARSTLATVYRRLGPTLERSEIKYAYASRGDAGAVGSSISARANQIESTTREFFRLVETEFAFLGAAELLSIFRKARRQVLDLPFHESFARGSQYVLLCSLEDFARFLTNEDGQLRRYIFDSNVRAFMGSNAVNEDIRRTLETPNAECDFCWLNNGVTILAASASVFAKSIMIAEPQIVNGLQTSESIYRHFSAGHTDPANRSVLVKVIVSSDENTRDSIIRSTNNQTSVEVPSLHATEKIQRDIEDYLKQHGLLYERRKRFYEEQGYATSDLITPMALAIGFVTLVMKAPKAACSLRQRFMRNPVAYDYVFSERHSIKIWPPIASVLQRVDRFLESVRPRRGQTQFLKSWRPLTSLIAVARVYSTFDYSHSDLAALEIGNLSDELLHDVWQVISEKAKPINYDKHLPRDRTFVLEVAEYASQELKIAKAEVIERVELFQYSGTLSKAFIDAVNELLPSQPWKPGTHKLVANQLNVPASAVSAAITELILRGARMRQVDGVVYGTDGVVVAVDPERIIPRSSSITKQVSRTKPSQTACIDGSALTLPSLSNAFFKAPVSLSIVSQAVGGSN